MSFDMPMQRERCTDSVRAQTGSRMLDVGLPAPLEDTRLLRSAERRHRQLRNSNNRLFNVYTSQ